MLTSKTGISRFQGTEIHQGLIEQDFLDFFPHQPARVAVERDVTTESLIVQDLAGYNDEYPITLQVRHKAEPPPLHHQLEVEINGKDDHKGRGSSAGSTGFGPRNREEVIKAKYLIGCDGAHSWTRHQVGLTLEGESSDDVWGVIDIVVSAITPGKRAAATNPKRAAFDRLS